MESLLFPDPAFEADLLQSGINSQLAQAGIVIAREEACELAERRVQCLNEIERVEFGEPAISLIAQELVESDALANVTLVQTLAMLQECFYQIRDELPVDVPDREIVEALAADFIEQGDAADVAKTPTEEIMARSKSYRQAQEEAERSGYRITDDEGRTYAFDSAEWEYDETTSGWDGEKWDGEWNE